jgi:nucleoside-diphosphate-sugar epimerase
MTTPPTLVIGANGFIGRAVVRALGDDAAAKIRAGTRTGNGEHHLRLNTTTVRCDLVDPSSILTAMAGQSVVIHCARDASNKPGGEPIGIDSIIAGAQKCGVKRFIYISSIAVHGETTTVIDDFTPPHPTSPYGISKRRAELACEAVANESFRIVVLRPTLVYGPGGEEWTMRYIRDLAAGRLTKLGPAGEARANLVYVDDLARFCTILTTAKIEPFTVFNINGDDPPSWNEYLGKMSSVLGFGTPPDPGSRSYHEARRYLRKLLRTALKTRRTLLPHRSLPYLDKWWRILEDNYAYNCLDQAWLAQPKNIMVSCEGAKQLGFHCETSLGNGLQAVADWARENQSIPTPAKATG